MILNYYHIVAPNKLAKEFERITEPDVWPFENAFAAFTDAIANGSVTPVRGQQNPASQFEMEVLDVTRRR